MFTDCDIIHAYTRCQAIEDGVLVDLCQPDYAPLIANAGIKIPIAMTAAAYSQTVWPLHDDSYADYLGAECQDPMGRLWDVLYLLSIAARSGGEDIHYTISFIMKERQRRTIQLTAVCGPGDDMTPVITIMLPGED